MKRSNVCCDSAVTLNKLLYFSEALAVGLRLTLEKADLKIIRTKFTYLHLVRNSNAFSRTSVEKENLSNFKLTRL